MDIDSYCLPDWPPRPQQLVAPLATNQLSKSATSPRHISIVIKPDSTNEFLRNSERQQILRRFSARRTEVNVFDDTMIQLVSRSNSARMTKPKISTRRDLSPKHLPSIKTPRTAPAGLLDESIVSPRVGTSIDLPFACPSLIRQHSMYDGRLSTILYDTCICRSDQVPLIRDLEFDTLIQLTSRLNSKQLIVVGIVNSNLRQFDNDQNNPSNELYQMFHTLHYHLNYGRSQICACRLSINDDYRCFIYDLAEATKQSSLYGPLLVRRHHVQPGFVLIYQNGKLVFGDSIFNGYGRNIEDLQKQLNHIKQQHVQQTALPDEFKFISDHQRTNPTILKSI